MEREIRRFSIEGSVSRHNCERDGADDDQWEYLTSKLRAVLSENEDIVENLRIQENYW